MPVVHLVQCLRVSWLYAVMAAGFICPHPPPRPRLCRVPPLVNGAGACSALRGPEPGVRGQVHVAPGRIRHTPLPDLTSRMALLGTPRKEPCGTVTR
jgi:hypothetical protein